MHIWLDHNCHASHIDGVLLSRARFTRFHSENIDSMYQQISSSDKLQLIITEGIYSMDGSNCSLTQLIILKQTLPDKILLIIDDAHSIGCFGSNGRGILEVINHIYTKCDILLGTFGKSFGSHGGFLYANKMIVNYLQHSVRSQIFSTNLPPAIIAASRAALEIINSDKGYSLRMALKHKIKYFQEYSNLNGITLSQPQKNFSAIQLICFENQEVVDKIYQFMFENNILVSKIKYPTVPKNQPRIRISISINHSIDDIKCLLDNLKISIAQYSSDLHSIRS